MGKYKKLFIEVLDEFDRLIEEDRLKELENGPEKTKTEKRKELRLQKKQEKTEKINKKLKIANLLMLRKFKELEIKKINLTSLGNSIAAGYSQNKLVKPLLERNESLENVCKHLDIELNKTNIARAQNNNDNRIFGYVLNNTFSIEIRNMSVADYSDSKRCKMNNKGNIELDDEISCKGIADIIKESDPSLANIVVYHGCTGSFLDNFTRGNRLHSISGIRKDHESLTGLLTYIQNQNRTLGTNTQVYLGGAPDILGIKLTNIFNSNIKKKSKLYANTSFVKPVRCKFFYDTGVDIHYDEIEYKKLNMNIIQSIDKNYLMNAALIDIDRAFYKLSEVVELYTEKDGNTSTYVNARVEEILSKWFNILKKNHCDLNKFKKRLLYYFKQNAPFDFHYIDKEVTVEKIKTYK